MDIGYQVFREMKEAVIGVGIFRIDGVRCYGTNTKIDQTDSCSLTEDGTVRFEVPGPCCRENICWMLRLKAEQESWQIIVRK